MKIINIIKTPFSLILGRRHLKTRLLFNRRKKEMYPFLETNKIKRYLDLSSYYKNNLKESPICEKKTNIIILWWDGFENCPDIIKFCSKSVIEHYSKDFNIILLDKNNIHNILNVDSFFVDLFKKNIISIQMYSDIIRFTSLYQLGGIWLDATIFTGSANVDLYKLYSFSEFNSVNSLEEGGERLCQYNNFFVPASAFIMTGWKNNIPSKICLELFKEFINKEEKKPYFLVDYALLCTFYHYGIENFSNTKMQTWYLINSYKKLNKYSKEIVSNHLSKLDWRLNNKSLIKYIENKGR